VLGDEAQRKRTLDGLGHSAGYMRRLVGQRLRLRLAPELRFFYDEGLDATESSRATARQTHAGVKGMTASPDRYRAAP